MQLDLYTAATLAKLGISMEDAQSGKVTKMPKVPGIPSRIRPGDHPAEAVSERCEPSSACRPSWAACFLFLRNRLPRLAWDCLTLSVVIITLNEEANLARTLASVAWADEIVVLDSGSTDRTREVAESYHAKFYVEPWKGFAAQKNSALAKATGDWILSLDADEEVEPVLAEEIRTALSAKPSVAGFWIPRKNFFLGRWIKHGGYYPDPKLRLFRRGAGTFEERLVHEDMQPRRCHGFNEEQPAAPRLSHARQLHRAHEPLLVAGREDGRRKAPHGASA